MKKVEVIIRRSKFDDVRGALVDAGVEYFSYWPVKGMGKAKEKQ